jgi:hypothetical protein
MPIDRCLPRKVEARLTQKAIPAKARGNKNNKNLFQYLSTIVTPRKALIWCKSVFLLNIFFRQINPGTTTIN